MTGVLTALIEESAKPLAAVESDFAIDSTGIGTTTYRRWYDHKWGKERSIQTWVKVHAMTGVTPTSSRRSARPPKSRLTPRNFRRCSRAPLSPSTCARSRVTRRTRPVVISGPYRLSALCSSSRSRTAHRIAHVAPRAGVRRPLDADVALLPVPPPEFLTHYHKRSNVETTFAMVKAKFGGSVRAKTPTAQVNEALLKFLCHNTVVLIQSIYELDLEPVFWQDCLKVKSLPQYSL